MAALVKTLGGVRLYAENNDTLKTYLADLSTRTERVFAQAEEFSLNVREDRLLHRKDDVLIDPDRLEGLPFALFRNAFRRLTFVRGLDDREILAFLRAVAADTSRVDPLAEDLVAALWKLQLPHLRYITIDALTFAHQAAGSSEEKQEIERLQGDVEAIVAAVYQSAAPSDDIVPGLSISHEDLEAMKEVRAEGEEDFDLLDRATERAVSDLDPDDVDDFRRQVEVEGHDMLVRRTMDVLVRLLFSERTSRDSAGSIEMLQQLLDSMLLSQRFSHATILVRRLRRSAEDRDDLQKLHIARQLLRLFSAENRILPLLREPQRSASRALGLRAGRLRSSARTLDRPGAGRELVADRRASSPAHRPGSDHRARRSECCGHRSCHRRNAVVRGERPPLDRGDAPERVDRRAHHERPRARAPASPRAGHQDAALLRRR
ncbi:MAG: hypothetical protein HC923_04240 [Myxococcales bacterium]|nr:hypothetical protein [Myxococcales bacterium]